MRYPNIAAERARIGMSQEKMASELSVTRKTLYNWERSGNIPQSALEKMSSMFGVPIDYLLAKSVSEEVSI